MKPGTLLLLAGGAGLIWYFTQLGVAGSVVNVVFEGVQIKSLTKFILRFNIQNVSNTTIVVNSMTAGVTVNGNNIGNASFFGPALAVPPNSQAMIDVNFQPSLISIPGTVANLILGQGQGSLDFVASGNMNVNNLVLPLQVETSAIL